MTQGAAGEHAPASERAVFPTRSYLRCIHAPPTTFPAVLPLDDILIASAPPRPPSGEALATKLALLAPGTGSSATLFESERWRRLSTNHVSVWAVGRGGGGKGAGGAG